MARRPHGDPIQMRGSDRPRPSSLEEVAQVKSGRLRAAAQPRRPSDARPNFRPILPTRSTASHGEHQAARTGRPSSVVPRAKTGPGSSARSNARIIIGSGTLASGSSMTIVASPRVPAATSRSSASSLRRGRSRVAVALGGLRPGRSRQPPGQFGVQHLDLRGVAVVEQGRRRRWWRRSASGARREVTCEARRCVPAPARPSPYRDRALRQRRCSPEGRPS
jgi:hypothetical protein